MNELGPGNAFMDSHLNADADLVAALGSPIEADFIDEPEPGVDPYPVLTFACVSAGNDVLGNGAVRVLTDPLYLVVVTGNQGYGQITDIADRADAALHQKQATITINGVDYDVCCFREKVAPLPARSENGVRFVRRGGYYRLQIQAL